MKRAFLLLLITISGITLMAKSGCRHFPDKIVILTFDDATASQYSVVAPLLKKFGFGATFFICEFPPHFQDTTKYMNWRQIRELDKMGFEIANHTRDHKGPGKQTAQQFREELEYIDYKCDSMKISRPVTFAYPGYDLNMQAIEILKEKGYLFARAGGGRPYDPMIDHPMLVPSWAMNSGNMQQMTDCLSNAKEGMAVVLTIHGVPDMEHPWVNTTPELFTNYLQYLADNHYKVIALRDMAKYFKVKRALKTMVPDLSKKLKN